jgi:hypothetical protein
LYPVLREIPNSPQWSWRELGRPQNLLSLAVSTPIP